MVCRVREMETRSPRSVELNGHEIEYLKQYEVQAWDVLMDGKPYILVNAASLGEDVILITSE